MYIDRSLDYIGMMAIKEKMFNGFVTVKEITLLIAFPIPLS